MEFQMRPVPRPRNRPVVVHGLAGVAVTVRSRAGRGIGAGSNRPVGLRADVDAAWLLTWPWPTSQ